MNKNLKQGMCALFSLCVCHAASAAESISVLHWWTSGGESKAVRLLKDDMTKQGYEWKDFAVAGGAGAAAMTALKAQVISGNAPSAAQIKGPLIQDWARPGHAGSNRQICGRVEESYASTNRCNHARRRSLCWGAFFRASNQLALDKQGGAGQGRRSTPPATWPEFFALADKFRAAGITPVAHGGQPWQDMTVWETVVLSQGPDFYKKALVDLDQKTLTSPQMVQVFETVKKIESYFDKGYAGRDWNLATAMVINGTGGMQFMGDWAKGEFDKCKQEARF